MSEFLCRIFVQQPLFENAEVVLEYQDLHYLKNVLRASQGQSMRLFNGQEGEWAGSILEITKSACRVRILSLLRPQTQPSAIILYFAPVRQNRLDVLVEKSTELGILEFRPILSDFTQVRKLNLERLQLQIKEASEQSEQLYVASIREPVKFDALLKQEKRLWICDERRTGEHILNMPVPEEIHIVVGPEGGFSEREKALMESHTKVSLGDSILRAETAAICAVSFGNYLMSKSK